MRVTLLHPEDDFDRMAVAMALVGAAGVLVVCNVNSTLSDKRQLSPAD